MVQIVSALDDGQLASAAEMGAERLAAGKLVAFPTETVYGLGARADDDAAVARIFAAKGRPSDHPLIVHVSHGGDPLAAALVFAAELSPLARRLIAACWPGPLTLIVPRRAGVGASAAGGQDSIGLRCPDHAVAQALFPLWATHPAATGLRVHLSNGLYVNATIDRLLGGWSVSKAP